jgi:hypothetical protein
MATNDLPWFGVGRDDRDFDADRDALAASLRFAEANPSARPASPGRLACTQHQRNPRLATRVHETSSMSELPNSARIEAERRAEQAKDGKHYGCVAGDSNRATRMA